MGIQQSRSQDDDGQKLTRPPFLAFLLEFAISRPLSSSTAAAVGKYMANKAIGMFINTQKF